MLDPMRTATHSVLFGETEIWFSLNYVDRKTLAIHVYPDGNVGVDAPMMASLEQIYGKVKKRASWIIKQQIQFKRYPPVLPERRYVSGETHRYLGRQYRLKVENGDKNTVKLKFGILSIQTPDHSTQHVRKILQAWYYAKAQTVFTDRYKVCLQNLERLGIIHNSGFQLRYMSKRWGSCAGTGNISLNPELIAAPKECIDYVITHELCHLKEHNHGPAFYRLLTVAMSDWEQRRKKLNELVEVRFI